MDEIMKSANFPADAIEEVLRIENKLKSNGNWNRVVRMAEEIMEELPDSEGLRAKLAVAETWEQELGVRKYTLDLLVLLLCWQILEKRYEEKKMPMSVFYATLDDLRCKLLECREVYGVNGVFVGFWYDRFFDMTRFTLGRLQFETEQFLPEEPYRADGVIVKKGDRVINIHVPSCGPLYKEDVDDALSRAAEFYKKEFPDGTIAFVIDSWLIDPDLVALLPEGNMKAFAERFTLLRTHKSSTFYDGWRVFGKDWQKAPEELPRRTKLQSSVADYLEKGGTFGEGYGILIYSV